MPEVRQGRLRQPSSFTSSYEASSVKSTSFTSLWHNRAYLLVWSGTAISLIGTQASQLAFPLLVLTLTNSAALAGLVGALRLLPYLLLSLPAGALLDRWDRKRVMMVCDTLRAICLASIPLALVLGMLGI